MAIQTIHAGHPPKEVLPGVYDGPVLTDGGHRTLSLYSNSFSHFPLLRVFGEVAGLLDCRLSHLRMSVRILVGGHQAMSPRAMTLSSRPITRLNRSTGIRPPRLASCGGSPGIGSPFTPAFQITVSPIFACAVGKCNDFSS